MSSVTEVKNKSRLVQNLFLYTHLPETKISVDIEKKIFLMIQMNLFIEQK